MNPAFGIFLEDNPEQFSYKNYAKNYSNYVNSYGMSRILTWENHDRIAGIEYTREYFEALAAEKIEQSKYLRAYREKKKKEKKEINRQPEELKAKKEARSNYALKEEPIYTFDIEELGYLVEDAIRAGDIQREIKDSSEILLLFNINLKLFSEFEPDKEFPYLYFNPPEHRQYKEPKLGDLIFVKRKSHGDVLLYEIVFIQNKNSGWVNLSYAGKVNLK